MPANDKEAYVANSFLLKIGGGESAGLFREVSGFDSEVETAELKRQTPKGQTDVIKVPGNRKWSNIELKRGVDQDKTLWTWHKLVLDGKIKDARKDCQITLLDYEMKPIVTYSLINAWPVKYSGMGLKADSNEVAVEGLTLAHEGFEMT
jgi:phage tail-like protein